MRCSWQNLNERSVPVGRFEVDAVGSAWRAGRAWLWFGQRVCVGFEWSHWSSLRQLGFHVTTGGGDNDIQVSLGLWFGNWYLSLSGLLSYRAIYRSAFGLATGLSFDGDRLRLDWRHDSACWPPERGRGWSLSVLDILLGKARYTEGTGLRSRIVVVMPEAAYTGTCVLRADSWKRPRWFRHIVRRAHIDMDEGQQVPFPGKGENAWDCGEDGIFGMTCAARTLDEAAEAVQLSAMRNRDYYGGGAAWRPAPPASAR